MSVDACAALVQSADPDRFASAMCASMPQRADLMILYAFNVEVARAPWVTQEEMIAEMRLQWWKDAIAEIYEDKTVRRHEVVTPLAEVIARIGLDRRLFDELIEARRFDIYREGHGTREAFDGYVSATSANVMEMAGLALGASDLSAIRSFGFASGVSNLIKALPVLYQAGRDPIPAGQIDRNACVEGRVDGELRGAIEDIAKTALAAAKSARADRKSVPRSVVPALLAGWQLEGPLKLAATRPEAVLTTDFEVSPARRSATLLWRSTTGFW